MSKAWCKHTPDNPCRYCQYKHDEHPFQRYREWVRREGEIASLKSQLAAADQVARHYRQALQHIKHEIFSMDAQETREYIDLALERKTVYTASMLQEKLAAAERRIELADHIFKVLENHSNGIGLNDCHECIKALQVWRKEPPATEEGKT